MSFTIITTQAFKEYATGKWLSENLKSWFASADMDSPQAIITIRALGGVNNTESKKT